MKIFKNLLVLELANVLAGPSVGMFFAELGARVIKIENPRTGGDVTRSWKLPTEPTDSDISSYFTAVNWGKESVAVDIDTDEGREIVLSLVQRADVIIASYKPGDAEKLQMDYETLAAVNPKIIYAEITGYGKTDSRTGYDAILQAASGFIFMNGMPDGPPVKMPVALIDILAAHQLKEGILLALLQQQQTGKGQLVQASLLKSGIASLANQATNWLTGGHMPQRMGSEHPNIMPYGSMFNTSDEKIIMLGVGNDAQFRQLCNALNCPEMAGMPDFSTNAARVNNRAEVNRRLAELIAQFDSEALLSDLQQRKVPAGGILSMPEVFEQPQGKELLLHGATQQGQSLIGVRSIAIEFDESQKVDLSPPPHLNQNGNTVLREFLGFSPEKIAELESRNVFGNI